MDDAERDAIVAEYRRIAAEWQPKDFQGTGCLMLLGAVVLFVAVPKLIGWLHLPRMAGPVALGVIVLSAVAGFILMGTRRLQASPADLVRRAAAGLASGTLEPAERRTQAVTIVFHAYDYRGPTMSSNYNPAEIATLLGDAKGYVVEVEQVLLDDLKIHAVFTAPRS